MTNIDKVLPYWTEEDRARLEEIEQEENTLYEEIHGDSVANRRTLPSNLKRWEELEAEANKIHLDVETRYLKAHSQKALLADVEEIVNAIEKADFQARIAERIASINTLQARGANQDNLDILRKYTAENYENCYNFILYFLRVQLNGLSETNTDKAIAIVEKRVALWYVKTHPDFLPMAHGKATDAFAYMSSRTATTEPIYGTATIDKFGVQLGILKFKELKATLGISTDKLLSTAIAIFTQHNDFRHTRPEQLKREVAIDLKEYATLCGYDVEEHRTATPEEAERERKRAKGVLDNFRKTVKKDLDVLQSSVLTWEEPIKQKVRNFDRISLVTRTRLENGYVRIWFTPEIASYLAERNLITQYPIKLLGISGRQPTAYYIGRKLAEHYNMDNNQIRGTHDRISIPALLAITELPTYEEVMKQDRHWDRRIKEPLEQALDVLTQEGVLKDWKYTHAKGVDLTEEEAYTISNYADFEKLYVHFTPADRVDHAERIEAKREARKTKRTSRKKKS